MPVEQQTFEDLQTGATRADEGNTRLQRSNCCLAPAGRGRCCSRLRNLQQHKAPVHACTGQFAIIGYGPVQHDWIRRHQLLRFHYPRNLTVCHDKRVLQTRARPWSITATLRSARLMSMWAQSVHGRAGSFCLALLGPRTTPSLEFRSVLCVRPV